MIFTAKFIYTLIIFIIVISILLIILWFIEKKLNIKIIRIKRDEKNFYIKKIRKIRESNPEKILEQINEIARDFFKEAFKIKKSTDYSELIKIFHRKNNQKAVEFCKIMTKVLYSKERITKEGCKKLKNILIGIVNDYNRTKEKIEEENQNKKKKTKKLLRKV